MSFIIFLLFINKRNMIKDIGKYYLYRYSRKDDNKPFYIGIGTKRKNRNSCSITTEYERAYSITSRNNHFLNIINSQDILLDIICESDDLNFIKEKEIEFIKLYGRVDKKTGILVNLTDGGDGNFNMTDEHREKLKILCSERFKDIPKTPETKIKMGQWQIGRKHSPEEITQRTNTRKLNAIKRGYYVPESKIEKESKVILQYDRNMILISEWKSISLAARTLNIKKGNIINVCKFKPRVKTAGGFIWRYKE